MAGGETEFIAAMAKKIADEIFSVFGWRFLPPESQNFECLKKTDHKKDRHPTDVVFSYEDPYSDETVYLNTDLKSYARSSINPNSTQKAIQSLCIAVGCANISQEWKNRYGANNGNERVVGLLVLYNHDGEYEDSIEWLLAGATYDDVGLSTGQQVVALGPQEIFFLHNVAMDIKIQRGEDKIPSAARCKFWYPDLVRVKCHNQSAASLEMLTGPWIILKFNQPGGEGASDKFVVWSRSKGKTLDEFKYLLDFLFRYQILNEEGRSIEIRMLLPSDDFKSNFRSAVDHYCRELRSVPSERIFSMVSVSDMNHVATKFSEKALGWRDG